MSAPTQETHSSRLDPRSDDEIVESLLVYKPVKSERNLWTFWDKGFMEMRPYVKRNVIGWVRRLGPDWDVRVLDQVPGSPSNVNKFLDSSNFHDAYNRGTMTGIYVGAQSSDIIRLPLLYEHGGCWMDAGTTLFRSIDDICWREIEDPSSPYEICGFAMDLAPSAGNDTIMSHFIAAKRGNEFVKRWHQVYLEMWKDRTTCEGLSSHPLLKQVQFLQVPADLQKKNEIDNVKFNDYVAIFYACKRVRMLEDPNGEWDGPRYWENHAMLLPVKETYLIQIMTNFDGKRQFELLSMRREGVDPADRNPEAENLVQALTTQCCNMKLSHGLKNTKTVHLPHLWDLPENEDSDIREGTFAAYLRWASIHLEQRRVLKPIPIPRGGRVIKAGLLEAIE